MSPGASGGGSEGGGDEGGAVYVRGLGASRPGSEIKTYVDGIPFYMGVWNHALLDLLGEPLLSSTLILPGETEPRTMGWEIKEELDHVVDIVVEAGETPAEPTTVSVPERVGEAG